MNNPTSGGALPVRRSYPVDTGRIAGLVIEIDATQDESALAVLQAQLHEQPEGARIIFGYDLDLAGLGAWVGDRKVRLRVWPAHIDEHDEISEDHPDDGGDVLTIDFDPVVDRHGLRHLLDTGCVLIAGPDAGPVPLLVDIEPALLAEVLDRL